ncbi:MAG TPA: hypothetical protein VKR58_04445 [Aquella sp.]|nr:hypothetical protein [Aquella sp.]
MSENTDNKHGKSKHNCAACNKIIESGGMTVEAEDYILYFCGEECYLHWHKKYKENTDK